MAEIETKRMKEHKIILENRERLEISGVDSVEVAVHSQFVCVVRGERLQVTGKNLEVTRLDVECGCVALTGEVTAICYVGEKKSLIKRIFK